MTRTVMRSLLVSIGVAALLAGCGTATAGSAAVVGDRRISVSDVQSATVDAQSWVGTGTTITQPTVLVLLAIAPYVQDAASQNGVGVSESETRSQLQARVPHPSAAAVTLLRANFAIARLQQTLGEEKAAVVLGEAIRRLHADGFKPNPRYGVIDAQTGGLTPQLHNWFPGSEQLADPTPSK